MARPSRRLDHRLKKWSLKLTYCNYKKSLTLTTAQYDYPLHRFRRDIYATNSYCGVNITISVKSVLSNTQSRGLSLSQVQLLKRCWWVLHSIKSGVFNQGSLCQNSAKTWNSAKTRNNWKRHPLSECCSRARGGTWQVQDRGAGDYWWGSKWWAGKTDYKKIMPFLKVFLPKIIWFSFMVCLIC